jgi:ABC-type transporter lipoprotein component MlaA
MSRPHSPVTRPLTTLLLSALLLAGCASQRPTIQSDYDPDADFANYQTFGFIQPLGTDKPGYSTLVSGYFKAAVRTQMERLGYTYSPQSPDLLVNGFTNTETRTDVRSSPSANASYGYFGYRSGLYLGLPLYGSDTKSKHYKVGTLSVDVVDAQKQQLIWEGIAEEKLSKEAMNNPQEAIQTTVQQIFLTYPTAQQHH